MIDAVRLLETSADDPGCDQVFTAMDTYADSVRRGDDVRATHRRLLIHLEQCPACREDVEGLLAAVRLPALRRHRLSK